LSGSLPTRKNHFHLEVSKGVQRIGRIRIKDIAEIANVSIGTVDRVIHNRGEVSDATRSRVKKILEDYNYSPDVAASSLALKREIRLAVVMPRFVNDHVFWKLPQSGISKAVEDLGHFNMSVDSHYFDQDQVSDFVRLTSSLPWERYHGVLFAPVFKEESVSFVKKCEQMNVPVILFNSMLEGTAASSYVGQDAFQSGYVAAKLINYGMEPRRDVAIVNISSRSDHYTHVTSREQGFRSYFEEHSGRIENLVTLNLNGQDDMRLFSSLQEAFDAFNIAGLFVTNSRVYKVADFLAVRGFMNIRLVGYDLLPESIDFLKREYIDFLISQQPEIQAYKGLNALFYLAAFSRKPAERQMMPIDIITRENLKYYVTQTT
jgi:LacI family transcriptional regulator